MANRFQRIIYNASVASPFLIVFAIVWFIKKQTIVMPAMCASIGILSVIGFFLSFSYGRKKLAPIQIRVDELTPTDGWVVVCTLTYFIPIISIVVESFDILLGCIGLVIILIIVNTNTASPNPLLRLCGYHFYSVASETGMAGYVLISNRNLRKKQDLDTVYRIFEFLLLDKEN